ncbi:hypothetical protein B1790_13400 [Mycobacterium sp. AT1]|nr:hypothetical protein B1790_13400 [Mycobacterium sp. AT1]
MGRMISLNTSLPYANARARIRTWLRNMVRRQPLVRWAEIPGAGHYVHDDDPAAFVDLVAHFLA